MALKEKPTEEITPMMKQTQDLVRQNLISQGFSAPIADMIIKMASDSLKGKEPRFQPPKTRSDRELQGRMREAVSQTRDMLHFMPKLMEKGYSAQEANELVDRARGGFEMPGFNRIESYDVSTIRDALNYANAHPEQDYRAVVAGLMFRGPTKAPAVRERPTETQVAQTEPKEETMRIGGRLAVIPRRMEMIKPEVPLPDYGTKPPSTKTAKPAMEYAYSVDIYGQKYEVVLSKELRGDIKSSMLEVLTNDPASIASITTPSGTEITKTSKVGLNDYVAYMASEYAAFQDNLTVTAAEARAVTEKPKAEKRKEKIKVTYTYDVEMPLGSYSITLNRELKGEDLKSGLLGILQNNPASVVSIMTPSGVEINKSSRVGLDEYIAYMASEYLAFRDAVKVGKSV